MSIFVTQTKKSNIMSEFTTPAPAPSNKTTMMYGVMFGVLMILQAAISYIMRIGVESSYGTIVAVLNYFILPILFIWLACNAYKNANEGFISFGQCLKTGVLVCLIAALLSAVGGVILNMAFPEYMAEVMEQAREQMLEQNPEMTEEQIEMGMSMAEKFSSPWLAIPGAALVYSFIGLVYSLIIGAIIKRDRPTAY